MGQNAATRSGQLPMQRLVVIAHPHQAQYA